MMPMQPPMGGPAGGPPPANPAPSEGAGQGDIRPQLMQLLTKAAQVAEQNGIDFKALVMEFLKGEGPKAPPPPAP